jgi:NAD(P)H-dependent FMN reductase
MQAMKVLVISCSLNPESRSRRLAERAQCALRHEGRAEVDLLDLRDAALPLCDGSSAYGHAAVEPVTAKLRDADAVILAVPIYNYYANAAAKNLIELTGRAWTGKVVGFLCAAGGRGSYMSVMTLANSLMLDFRCLIVPRFVYTTEAGFEPDGSLAADVAERVDLLADELVRIAGALRSAATDGATRA